MVWPTIWFSSQTTNWSILYKLCCYRFKLQSSYLWIFIHCGWYVFVRTVHILYFNHSSVFINNVFKFLNRVGAVLFLLFLLKFLFFFFWLYYCPLLHFNFYSSEMCKGTDRRTLLLVVWWTLIVFLNCPPSCCTVRSIEIWTGHCSFSTGRLKTSIFYICICFGYEKVIITLNCLLFTLGLVYSLHW